MVRVLAMLVGGVFLFSAGLIGTLGVRGKLNAQTLDQFLGKEQADEEGADGEATDEDAEAAPDHPSAEATKP